MTVSELYYDGFGLGLGQHFHPGSKPWEYFMVAYFVIATILTPMFLGTIVSLLMQLSPVLTLALIAVLTLEQSDAFNHLQYVFFKWPFGNLYRGEAFQMRAYRSIWWFMCVWVSRSVFVLTMCYYLYQYFQ